MQRAPRPFVKTPESMRPKRLPVPLYFPEEATLPESKRHLHLRTVLYLVLKRAFSDQASIGSDQFVYWNASDPSRCLAPDAFVRFGLPDDTFGSWKTWERGAPELCVEIVSDSDSHDAALDQKLARYHELGTRELVRFDADAREGSRIRVWDRVEGDLVERAVEGDSTPCAVLGLMWVVRPTEGHAVTLRLASEEGTLLPTPTEVAEVEAARARTESERARTESERARTESERAQTEATRAQAESERARAEAERAQTAERRVAELEAELRRREAK